MSAYAASSTTGGSAGFRPFSTCRIHDGVSPSCAASSSTGTPLRRAARIARSRRDSHLLFALSLATVRCSSAASRNSSRPLVSSHQRFTQSPSRRAPPR